jgi:pimeloyl-ACP methyl ester carboxylesterase
VSFIRSKVGPLDQDVGLGTRLWILPANVPAGFGDRVFVLVHGIGLSHRVYGRLAARLAEHGAVVGLDLPGFGKDRRRPANAVSVEQLADYVDHVLSEANIESAVVIGHSMGAQVALELALKAPQRVEALVLVGPVVNPRRFSLLQQALALVRDSALEPWDTAVRVIRDYISCGVSWYLVEAREMMRYRTHVRVAELRVPLLVIRGQNDVIAPADWCDWLAAHGSGSAQSVPGKRHLVIHSAPGPTAEIIARFVSKLPSRDVG